MASEKFAGNILSIAAILQKRSVKYLVVGGTAVDFYGYSRPTTLEDGSVSDKDDFDFWFNPVYPNYLRLLDAFDDMGLDITDIREEEYPNPKRSYFRFKFTDFTLDFIPTVGGGYYLEILIKRGLFR